MVDIINSLVIDPRSTFRSLPYSTKIDFMEAEKPVFIVLIFILFLVSCGIEREDERQNIQYEFRTYTLDKVYPPKHFYVDLTDIETGLLYRHVYVSKHCNNWRNLTIGDTVVLKREMWNIGGDSHSSFFDLYDELCNRQSPR